MTATNERRRGLFISGYHQNDSLLLQFILSEFLSTYREIQKMHVLFKELQKKEEKLQVSVVAELTTRLKKLSGISSDTVRFFSWGGEVSPLHKLSSYTALLIGYLSPCSKTEEDLYRQVSESLLLAIEIHDLIGVKNSCCLSLFTKMSNHIRGCAEHISKLLCRFSEDENLIFFLLRHREEYDTLFHAGYTKSLLHEIAPRSLDEWQEMVMAKYRKRGFTQLMPSIAQKFEDLKNS